MMNKMLEFLSLGLSLFLQTDCYEIAFTFSQRGQNCCHDNMFVGKPANAKYCI